MLDLLDKLLHASRAERVKALAEDLIDRMDDGSRAPDPAHVIELKRARRYVIAPVLSSQISGGFAALLILPFLGWLGSYEAMFFSTPMVDQASQLAPGHALVRLDVIDSPAEHTVGDHRQRLYPARVSGTRGEPDLVLKAWLPKSVDRLRREGRLTGGGEAREMPVFVIGPLPSPMRERLAAAGVTVASGCWIATAYVDHAVSWGFFFGMHVMWLATCALISGIVGLSLGRAERQLKAAAAALDSA